MVSAQALIIIALRAKPIENAVDYLQPKMVTVVTSQESMEYVIDIGGVTGGVEGDLWSRRR